MKFINDLFIVRLIKAFLPGSAKTRHEMSRHEAPDPALLCAFREKMKQLKESDFIWTGSCWSFTLEYDYGPLFSESMLVILGDEQSPYPSNLALLNKVVGNIDCLYQEAISYLDNLDPSSKASEEFNELMSIRLLSSEPEFLLDISFTYSNISVVFKDFKPTEWAYSENYYDEYDY